MTPMMTASLFFGWSPPVGFSSKGRKEAGLRVRKVKQPPPFPRLAPLHFPERFFFLTRLRILLGTRLTVVEGGGGGTYACSRDINAFFYRPAGTLARSTTNTGFHTHFLRHICMSRPRLPVRALHLAHSFFLAAAAVKPPLS